MSSNGGSPPLSWADIVNLSALLSLRKALGLKVLNFERNKFLSHGVMHDIYRIGPIVIYRTWLDTGPYHVCPPRSPGRWVDTDHNFGGNDIISLKLHVETLLVPPKILLPSSCSSELLREAAAQFRPEATTESVITELTKCLEIDAGKPTIKQRAAFRGWSQVAAASSSSPLFGMPEGEEGAGAWPQYRPDRVPFIGTPQTKFEIRDASGRLQQIIGSWPTAWGKPAFLSFTLWANDLDPLIQRWMFGRSAIKVCPYGLSSAMVNKDAIVAIDDDLRTVDRDNPLLIKRHGAASPMIFVAWPRGLYGATPAGTDWSQLKDRKVVVAVGDDRDSFVNALELNDELLKVGVNSVEFVLPKKAIGGTDPISVDYTGGALRGVRKDASELSEIAKQIFGITKKFMSTTALSPVWKIGDDLSISETEVILVPGIERGTVNVIYSNAGSGKSWFVLHILYALATGGKLWGRFHAPKKLRCLYLAGETAGKMCKRLQDIHAAMNGGDAEIDIEVYPYPGTNIEKLNLEDEEAWQRIEKQVEMADVIAIDHLTAFTSGGNTPDRWSRLNAHLRRLTQKGKTILLVHHAGKNGQQLGTIKLDIDIDLKIHIERLPKAANGSLIDFEKNRDDLTLGKALQPFQFFYEKGPDGLIRWWTKDAQPSEKKAWISRPETDVSSDRAVDEDFIVANFEGREADIIRCLATALLKGIPGVKRVEIDRHLGVSEETTRSVFRSLVAKRSVVVEGNGKATRYALSEEIKRSVIRE